VLPSALPLIFAAARVARASFIVMFATEMINASSGLGHLIRAAESGLRFDLMYVSLVSIAILGYAGIAAAPRSPAGARLAGTGRMSRLILFSS